LKTCWEHWCTLSELKRLLGFGKITKQCAPSLQSCSGKHGCIWKGRYQRMDIEPWAAWASTALVNDHIVRPLAWAWHSRDLNSRRKFPCYRRQRNPHQSIQNRYPNHRPRFEMVSEGEFQKEEAHARAPRGLGKRPERRRLCSSSMLGSMCPESFLRFGKMVVASHLILLLIGRQLQFVSVKQGSRVGV
jgi:hypothetical protein